MKAQSSNVSNSKSQTSSSSQGSSSQHRNDSTGQVSFKKIKKDRILYNRQLLYQILLSFCDLKKKKYPCYCCFFLIDDLNYTLFYFM